MDDDASQPAVRARLGGRLLLWVGMVMAAIAFSHIAAVQLYLYWLFPWIDIPAHFLGGLWVGLAALWVMYFSGYVRSPAWNRRASLLVVCIGIAAIGSLWEVYEWMVQTITHAPIALASPGDTVLDIAMDLLGAGTAWLLAYPRFIRPIARHPTRRVFVA